MSITVNLLITLLTWQWLTGHDYHNVWSVTYAATHRTIWALTCAVMLLLCSTGHAKIVNKVLSWKVLTPLSRLTYQSYLLNSIIIARFVYEARQPTYASQLNLVINNISYLLFCFVLLSQFSHLFDERLQTKIMTNINSNEY